jgi:uncharacterized protein with PIN domain
LPPREEHEEKSQQCVAEFDCPTLFWEGSHDEMREQFVRLLEHIRKLIGANPYP